MPKNDNGHKIKNFTRRKSREEEIVGMVTEHKGHHVHKIIRISQKEIKGAALAVQRVHTNEQ